MDNLDYPVTFHCGNCSESSVYRIPYGQAVADSCVTCLNCGVETVAHDHGGTLSPSVSAYLKRVGAPQ